MSVCQKNYHPTNNESMNPKYTKKQVPTEYYKIDRNLLDASQNNEQRKGVVDLSDDSSDCSNTENKLDNFYKEAHLIEAGMRGIRDTDDKDYKFKEAIKGVLRLENIRKKISDTNYEKLFRTLDA